MSAPHLTILGYYGSDPSKNKVMSHRGHLLTIAKASYWQDKTMVITPQEEKYTTAASYVTFGASETRSHSTENQACAKIREIFNAKTSSSWISGHKSCFHYWARGDSQMNPKGTFELNYTADPWYVRQNGATLANAFLTTGCGASWSALYFNLYQFPLCRANRSSLTQTNLKMYLRLWNPSLLAFGWCYLTPVDYWREIHMPPDASYLGSGSLNMKYNFTADLGAPSSFDTQESQAQTIDFTSASVVNNGRRSGFSRYEGTTMYSYAVKYNPWGITAPPTTTLEQYSLNGCWRYNTTEESSVTEYFTDVEIPFSIVQRIFDIQYGGSGGFWMTIGPSASDFFTSNLVRGYSAMMYFSRVELVMNVKDMSVLNNI